VLFVVVFRVNLMVASSEAFLALSIMVMIEVEREGMLNADAADNVLK